MKQSYITDHKSTIAKSTNVVERSKLFNEPHSGLVGCISLHKFMAMQSYSLSGSDSGQFQK